MAPDDRTRPDGPGKVLIGRFSRYRDVKRAVDSLRVARIPERRITVPRVRASPGARR